MIHYVVALLSELTRLIQQRDFILNLIFDEMTWKDILDLALDIPRRLLVSYRRILSRTA